MSSCALNLVRAEARPRLFAEISRVLKPGGRAVISDIVSDQDVPADLQADPELWSGCISGAVREDAFLSAFAHAGFRDIHLADRQSTPLAHRPRHRLPPGHSHRLQARGRHPDRTRRDGLIDQPWAGVHGVEHFVQ